MKSYYIAYTTQEHPSEIETEEIDFNDDAEINQQTVAESVEDIHNDWYDRVSVRQVIAWSKIE